MNNLNRRKYYICILIAISFITVSIGFFNFKLGILLCGIYGILILVFIKVPRKK